MTVTRSSVDATDPVAKGAALGLGLSGCLVPVSTGENQPPPRGARSTVPGSPAPWTQRTKRAEMDREPSGDLGDVSVPASYARAPPLAKRGRIRIQHARNRSQFIINSSKHPG